MKKNGYLEGISPNVIKLGMASFLNDISTEMIMPILPILLSEMGASGVMIGLVGGLRDSISSILKVVFGWLSDRRGERKVFVSLGYITSVVFKVMLAFAQSWQNVIIAASLERVGKGVRAAPSDAIIAESMPKEKGKGFGVHRVMDTSGAIIGSIIVFLLVWYFSMGSGMIILIAGLIGVLSLIPLYYIKEPKAKPRDVTLRIGLSQLSKPLRGFIFISAVFALANFSYMFFILRAQNAFPGQYAIAIPVLLYILFNVFYAAFALPFGVLSDRIGRRRILISGQLLFSLVCLGFVAFSSLVDFVILFALYGIVNAIIHGNQRAYVADLCPPHLKATALGTFHTIVGLCALPASIIAGWLWESAVPTNTFTYGGLVGLASVGMFIYYRQHFKQMGK